MNDFKLEPGEKLLVNDPYASWLKTEMTFIPGALKLTDKRLVFVKNAVPFGSLFFKSMRSHILQEYPLSSIANFSRETLYQSERLIIDNGMERPKKYLTSKAEVLEAELKRLTGK
jgi:hypothetical protein